MEYVTYAIALAVLVAAVAAGMGYFDDSNEEIFRCNKVKETCGVTMLSDRAYDHCLLKYNCYDVDNAPNYEKN